MTDVNNSEVEMDLATTDISVPVAGETLIGHPAYTAQQPGKRILVVDDNPAIHDDFLKILGSKNRSLKSKTAETLLFGESIEDEENLEFQIDSAYQGEDALALVQKSVADKAPYVLAFMDMRMPPGWDGIETISRIWKVDPRIQIVLCTAYSDYSWTEIIQKLGRTDRLLILKKPFDILEVRQLVCSLGQKWELALRLESHLDSLEGLVRQRTAEVEKTFSIVRATLEATADGIIFIDQDGIPVAHNRRFLEMWQIPDSAVTHHDQLWSLIGQQVESDKFKQAFAQIKSGMDCNEFDLLKLKDGRSFEWCFQTQKIGQSNKGRVWTFRDATKRVALEEQLRQSQKMECVGQLAGGVAHDFNNILTIIGGHASLLQDMAAGHDKESIDEILTATQRATNLTRQLLGFSRRQIAQLLDLDLYKVITSSTRMLQALIGANIRFELDLSPALPLVRADAGMIEQVLMNLAINSRDAMPDGGTLTIRIWFTSVTSAQAAQFPDAMAGDFVGIEVSDTGCGIAPENLSRIFEPFFTTKDIGHGTGLGLAMVYGIVKQHKGWITVQSEIGKGTKFNIFLPAVEAKLAQSIESFENGKMMRGKETILLVEDETPVRNLIARVLRGLGYQIIEAASAIKALELQPAKKIDLLLTDMVMPEGMGGRELAEKMTALQPGLKVIFMSGFSSEIFEKKLVLTQGYNFLQKPYSLNTLAQTLRKRLD